MADEKSVHTAIGRKKFDEIVHRCKAPERKGNEAKGELGGIIGSACKDQNLHRGAFGLFRRLDKMTPAKRSEFLFHFDTYRAWQDEAGGKWAQEDLLEDRAPAVAGAAAVAKADGAAAKTAGEPERDLRPRHLRAVEDETIAKPH